MTVGFGPRLWPSVYVKVLAVVAYDASLANSTRACATSNRLPTWIMLANTRTLPIGLIAM